MVVRSRIAELRQEKQLTQRELADLLEVTEQTVANWERGRSSVEWIEIVVKLCTIFDCSPNDLIKHISSDEVDNPKSKILADLHNKIKIVRDEVTQKNDSAFEQGFDSFNDLKERNTEMKEWNTEMKEWNTETEIASTISPTDEQVVALLRIVPGMTTANIKDFQNATPLFTLKNQTVVKFYENPLKVPHIFLVDCNNKIVFAGYVGIIHRKGLKEAINNIKKKFS